MIIRGSREVINVQITREEMEGIERLHSCAQGEHCVYIDMNEYFDNEESFDIVDEFLDKHTGPDILCFFV